MSKTITIELHPNAKVSEATLCALIKWAQFHPELVHTILSGMIAQNKYHKENPITN